MEGSTDQKTDTVKDDSKSVTNDEVVDESETEENDEVPENIRTINIKRKFCRSAFTKLNNKLLVAIESGEDETLIKGYMVNLHQKFDDLKSIENQIQDAVGITELEDELKGFQTYEEKFEASVLMVTEIEEKSEAAGKDDSEKEKHQHIKFPTIKLEKFSGRKNTIRICGVGRTFQLIQSTSQGAGQNNTVKIPSLATRK